MLTIHDFFSNLRNDQIIPITQCENKDIFALYSFFENFIVTISGHSIIGIPDNIDYDFLGNYDYNDTLLDFLGYLTDKVKEMEPDNKIYYIDCTDIDVKKDEYGFVQEWYFIYSGNDHNTKNTLSSLYTIINLRDDKKSSYWYNQPPYVRYVDYTNSVNSKTLNRVKELLTTIVIPIYDQSQSLELAQFFTKLKPELKVRVYYDGSHHNYPENFSSKINDVEVNITMYDYHISNNISCVMSDVLQIYPYMDKNSSSKYYLMVEVEYDDLINNSLTKLCNYLKMTNYWGSTYLLMNDFNISTLISNKTLKDSVVNMHDVIANL
ncbi:hypothetical protein PBI_SCTP2_53 [Salicola phage SCTP-2]|nr:hypothetical protein PBI_SCTP2_53 [Salicola phage SCTP-2]